MEILGLLFDLDGTLIETNTANLLAYNLALASYGYEISEEAFLKTNGIDSRDFLARLFPDLSSADVECIRSAKSESYPEFFYLTKVNMKLLEIIDNNYGVRKMGIVTNGKEKNVLEILDYHNLADKFDIIITGNDVVKPKPDPEAYFLAVKKIGLKPCQLLAFEDSESGCQSAIAAKISTYRVKFYV